jgi:N-acyl-D-amino-acid deacylase
MAAKNGKQPVDVLLKGGLLVDGTGAAPRTASLLIRGGRIHRICERPIRTTGLAIDCTGLVVAPGFIDVYSHLDAAALPRTHDALKGPLAAQGLTTVVGGACGWSAAGTRESSGFPAQVAAAASHGLRGAQWDTVGEMVQRLAGSGISANLALLAGHGSARASIRGLAPSPLHPYEGKELLWLLEHAMDQGACGVSLGLQQVPGMFAREEELREVALLVRRKGKVLAVHLRAYSDPAPGERPRGSHEPRILSALREALDLARRTGVRLQVSHLQPVGTRAWRACEACLRAIEQAAADGVDVRFDITPRTVREVPVTLLLPPWFLQQIPGAWEEPGLLRRAARELHGLERNCGVGAAEVTLARAAEESLAPYEGMALAGISRSMRLRPAAALAEIARRSRGDARISVGRCGSERLLEALVRHPACLLAAGSPGAGSPGAFPRFLQIARERKLLALEEVVHRMTGAAAERFGISDRGILAEKLAADVVVFDWEKVADNATAEKPAAAPSGIEYVFINGTKIMSGGRREAPLTAGIPLV